MESIMVSKYFELKTKEAGFEEHITCILNKFKDKKVIIYGVNNEFKELNKKYNFDKKFNIVAVVGEKPKNDKYFNSYKIIQDFDIIKENYDAILVINEKSINTLNFLKYDLLIENKEIESVFEEEFKDECVNINYLEKYKFDKTLPKLIKKLKDKKVVLYGAGVFLELIKKYYDLSKLNVIGITDKRFEEHSENDEFLGYKVYSPDEIIKLNPDYVVVATKMYVNIIENLYYNTLKGTKIKIKPLLKKGFFDLLKEI